MPCGVSVLWLVAKPLLPSPDEFRENERIGENGANRMFLVTLAGQGRYWLVEVCQQDGRKGEGWHP